MTDTQAIKDRLDIAQFIGEYLQVKKAGVNYKACCPFHHEKTPSFMIQPEKQIWHCFGCGKGGDIFSFLQEMEGLDFSEALKILADRAGVKLDTYTSEVNKSQKNRVLEINAKAAYFFHHFLLEMPSVKIARDYLQRRQLKPETINDWQVGYIPDQWDLLLQYLLKKGFSIDDILASGLIVKKDNADINSRRGFYDRFRGRVMFPIWDAHGNIVGFTGRILVETEKTGGKYVNTPQTIVFDKSRLLYGLNKAKTEIKNKDLAVLVEGQMDVIACHQANMKNVVASSGTALTFEQIKLLKRYTNNIAIAFDADAAGQNAAKRGIDAALEQGMNIKIIKIPEGAGKDADECLKKDSAVWFRAVESATDVMEWYFNSVFASVDLKNQKQKQNAADIFLSEINRLPNSLERDHWVKMLSDKIKVESTVLREEMKRLAAGMKNPKAPVGAGKNNNPAPIQNLVKPDRDYLLKENLWSLFLKFPKLIFSYWSYLSKDFFEATPHAALYEIVFNQYNKGNTDVEALKKTLLEGVRESAANLLLLKADNDYADFTETEADKEVSLLLIEIKKDWLKTKRQQLTDDLTKAQAANDNQKSAEILKALMELN